MSILCDVPFHRDYQSREWLVVDAVVLKIAGMRLENKKRTLHMLMHGSD